MELHGPRPHYAMLLNELEIAVLRFVSKGHPASMPHETPREFFEFVGDS